MSARGIALPRKVGAGFYDLTSVALQRASGSTGLRVAGVRVAKGIETLDQGTETGPLTPVDGITGDLSRPDWAPNRAEFWIGSGTKVYRVTTTGAVGRVQVATVSGQPVGRVASVRFSPDGGRVALVLVTTDQDEREISQVWVGAVVRGSGGVRVDGLVPITAVGVAVTDISWNDELRIFGIGHEVATGVAGIYEFQSDGSRWSPVGSGSSRTSRRRSPSPTARTPRSPSVTRCGSNSGGPGRSCVRVRTRRGSAPIYVR